MKISRRTLIGGMLASTALNAEAAINHGINSIITVDFVRDFGGVGNGSTDNSSQLIAFGVYARAKSALGFSIILTVSAGQYNFDSATAFTSLFGILNLTFDCNGATFQSTQTGGSTWIIPSFPNLHTDFGAVVALVASCAAGDQQITTLTASDAANFPVGASVAVMSEDIQISSSNFSYPPNCNKFDYVTVRSNNPSTGVVTFTPALINSHSANNIDGPGPIPCGKARIWLLDGTFSGMPFKWATRNVYNGMTVGPNSSASQYVGMLGLSQLWSNCILPGMDPTQAQDIVIDGGQTTTVNEPDKLVRNLTIRNHWSKTFLTFQSSSIDNLLIENSQVDVFLGSGLPKHITLDNNTIAVYGEGIGGSKYGHNLDTALNGGTVASWPFRSVIGGANKMAIDGVDVTYASNIITVPKSLADLADWNVVPGVTRLNLCTGSGDYFTGDLGTSVVSSLTDDASNIYIHVPEWPSSLPAYANGNVYISRTGSFSMLGVTGCPEVVRGSAAYAAGKNYWELLIDILTGGGSGNWNDGSGAGNVGSLISATFNVTSSAGGGSLLSLDSSSMVAAATMGSAVPFAIHIDCTVTGLRTFTQSALTGKTGADAVLLNSVSQSTLPSGKWVQTPFTWAFSSGSPHVAISLEFDCGTKFRMAA